MFPGQPIYLDHQATTPLAPEVLAAMLPYFIEKPGNPASNAHGYGWEAAAAVKNARETLAQAIHAHPDEIIFTSGATEADNLAIKGIAESYISKGRHIVTLKTEHAAVLEPCRYLERYGFEVTYLDVNPDGRVNLETLQQALRPETILVSVMLANNEIGVIQPLVKISQLCHPRGILLHTDAAQALGKVPLDVQALGVDLMSLTAHKLYGPKGIGALYIRRRSPLIQVSPQLHGGGQEQGVRSGTLATPLIVGFAQAVELATSLLATEALRLAQLRERLWQGLEPLGELIRNGHPSQTLPGCLNVSWRGLDGAALIRELQPHLALSSGSACSSSHPRPSHVLLALGRSFNECRASLRFGLGRSTTADHIDYVLDIVSETVRQLRQSALQPSTVQERLTNSVATATSATE